MNQDQAKSKYDRLSVKIKETWDRLSDEDIALAGSDKDEFFIKLQETYGIGKENAEKRLDQIEKSCAANPKAA